MKDVTQAVAKALKVEVNHLLIGGVACDPNKRLIEILSYDINSSITSVARKGTQARQIGYASHLLRKCGSSYVLLSFQAQLTYQIFDVDVSMLNTHKKIEADLYSISSTFVVRCCRLYE